MPASPTTTTSTPRTATALRYVVADMGHGLSERRRVVHRHHLLDHRLVAVEAALLVAAERVLDHVAQALVAVGARSRRPIQAGRELVDEIVVGDQRPGDADAVAVPLFDRLPND